MSDMNEASEYVAKQARERAVKFIRLWLKDNLGSLKSMAITIEALPEALEAGIDFDGASIEGFARVDESDKVAMPDPATFAILPWRPQANRVAPSFCARLVSVGSRLEGYPLSGLARQLMRACSI